MKKCSAIIIMEFDRRGNRNQFLGGNNTVCKPELISKNVVRLSVFWRTNTYIQL